MLHLLPPKALACAGADLRMAAIAARESVSWRMRASHVAISISPVTPGFRLGAR